MHVVSLEDLRQGHDDFTKALGRYEPRNEKKQLAAIGDGVAAAEVDRLLVSIVIQRVLDHFDT